MDIKITKKQKTGIIVFLGFILILTSIIYFKNKASIPEDEIKGNKVLVKEENNEQNETSKDKKEVKPKEEVKEIKAYICGYVLNPGVYLLREGDRLEDLIKASGGFKEEADSEGINLAYQVKDQDYLRVGSKEEALKNPSENPNIGLINTKTVITNSSEVGGTNESNDSDKININTGAKEDLTKLPRVGEAIAQRIIDHREKEGEFKSVEDIKDVSGIGEKMFENIKDQITI